MTMEPPANTSVATAELSWIEQRNLRSVSDVLPAWNRADVPGILAFYHESIVWRNVALDETYSGKEAVASFLARLFRAFPDLTFEVTHKIARGDDVAEQWLIQGTHLGPFLSIPPTHRRVVIPGMSMVRLRDGKFLRDEFYFDAGGVLRQFGLIPPLAAGETVAGRVALRLLVAVTRLGGTAARRQRRRQRAN